MDEFPAKPRHSDGPAAEPAYRPPTVTYLGDLAQLTQKTVGAADGEQFLGLDIGTI